MVTTDYAAGLPTASTWYRIDDTGSDESTPNCNGNCTGAIAGAELLVNGCQSFLDRNLRDIHARGNCTVTCTLAGAKQDLGLFLAQREFASGLFAGEIADFFQHAIKQFRAELATSVARVTNGRDQLVAWCALEQITVGSGFQCLGDVRLVSIGCQHDNRALELLFSQAPDGNERLEALAATCRVTNVASRRVLEKCGFQWTGAGLCRVRALRASVPSDRFRLDRRTWASLRAWGKTRLPVRKKVVRG